MEKDNSKPDEFSVTFKNGALLRLKKIADELNIPHDNLDAVLIKGISLIDLVNEDSRVIFKKGKEEYVIDLRLL